MILDNEPALIPKQLYLSLPQFHIKELDLLITVVGTLGKVAIAKIKDTKSIFSCKSTILRVKSINPYYLLTYLNTTTGLLFSLRGKRGAIQEGLNLSDLKEIKVFIPNDIFQTFIEKIVRKSFLQEEKSTELYNQAQSFLLSELGLNNWKPKHKLSYIKNFSDVEEAKRFDAEYFQPKYDEIIKAIKNYQGGWDVLGDVVKIKDKNFNPQPETEYKYIELANIGNNGVINDCTFDYGKALPTRARRKINTHDIIVSSIEGSLSSIAIIPESLNNTLCSTGFYVINSEKINSESLFIYLKSIAGQEQLKKGCNGTILTTINSDEFKKIVIPVIQRNIQEEIKSLVIDSNINQSKSKSLLEIAKKGVEMAIEEDENEAEKWITGEVEKLGVVLDE